MIPVEIHSFKVAGFSLERFKFLFNSTSMYRTAVDYVDSLDKLEWINILDKAIYAIKYDKKV